MANVTIKIEKVDVKTSILGKNIMVECQNNINLVFTTEALEELFLDFKSISDYSNYENYRCDAGWNYLECSFHGDNIGGCIGCGNFKLIEE